MDFKHPYFTEEEKLEYIEDVYEMLKQGYSHMKMEEELGISIYYIKRIISCIVSSGKITEEQIKSYREKYLQSEKNEKLKNKKLIRFSNEKEFQDTVNKMSQALEKGERADQIKKRLKLNSAEYKKCKRYAMHLISYEQIKNAKELRRLREFQYVVECTIKGYSKKYIYRMRPEIAHRDVNEYLEVAKELGLLKIVDDSKIEHENRVKNGMKLGLTPLEMITPTLNRYDLWKMMNQYFDEGIISKEEYNKKLKIHKKETEKQETEKIKGLIRDGFKPSEIIEIMKITNSKLYTIRRKCKQNNDWYSDEEVRQFREARKLIQKRNNRVENARRKAEQEREKKSRYYPYSKKRYLRLIQEEEKNGYEIDKDELDFIISLIMESPKLANKENLKIVLSKNLELNGFAKVYETNEQLITKLKNTIYGEALKKYQDFFRKKTAHFEEDKIKIIEQISKDSDNSIENELTERIF